MSGVTEARVRLRLSLPPAADAVGGDRREQQTGGHAGRDQQLVRASAFAAAASAAGVIAIAATIDRKHVRSAARPPVRHHAESSARM